MKEREEGSRPAVYFLSGESDGVDAIYIGECDSLSDRFRGKHHALEKADWQQIAVASTTDETFNKAHARRAEHLLVEVARSLRRTKVFTDQTSAGKLSDGDAAFARDFADDVALLAEILGVRVFRGRPSPMIAEGKLNEKNNATLSAEIAKRENPAQPFAAINPGHESLNAEIFRFIGARDVSAQMMADGTGFILLAGSELRKSVGGACPTSSLALRTKLHQSDLLEQHPQKPAFLRLRSDFPVGSTSAAAAVLTCTSLRGPHVWEHEATGQRYDKWIDALQRTTTPT
ncbi:GIY-YIG nuclease family protein [Roseomonas frigidaquae]|uniref:GIY-YIG nuclease family protein n=1 Tax=Falsiroseomonas frigidaquae TaxID=487318 RepID=A0ABX1F0V5_9PROT|nr:GIY-YIG nuclease family protein [Falsiroseomonas frigidaquae]NKE45946.1 GIY-YIG nuclease family protein [Falsiroseomonas frigidaquae]